METIEPSTSSSRATKQRDSNSPKKNKHAKQTETDRNLDEISVEKDNNCSEFAKELKKKGLDPSRWEKVFQKQGIESTEQLQHIDQSTLNKLLGNAEFSWEKCALEKLHIQNNTEDATRIEALMTNLRTKYPDPQKFISDDFQTYADRRRLVFEDNDWMKPFDLDKMNERLKKETSGQLLVVRKPLRSCDVINKISAGQLLRGQFIHKNFQESSLYRHTLIEVVKFELLSPGISETMEVVEFNNKEQSDKFESALKQSGKSLAIALFVGIPFIKGAQGHLFGGGINTEEDKTTTNNQESFVSISQILNVPTASFTLSHQNVNLSQFAKEALKRLYDTYTSRLAEFERECLLFFHKYGSHFYTGTCHFGGRYTWKVTCLANSEEKRLENYKTAKLALNGSISGGYIWFGGEINGSYENNNEKVDKKREYKEKSFVSKSLEKFGGPQEVDDISLWKKGLAEYNDTWVIIDKDVSQKCYEGVWELIKGNSEFSDAEPFSKEIQSVWQKVYATAEEDDISWSRSQLYLDWDLETSPIDVDGSEQAASPIQTKIPQSITKKSGLDLAIVEKNKNLIKDLKSTLFDLNTGQKTLKRVINKLENEK